MTPRRRLRCCAQCFNDRHIQQTVTALSEAVGECNFCGARGVPLLEPSQLAELFAPLITIYEEHEDGRTLVEWFAEDWNLFNDGRVNEAGAVRLLGEILDSGEITRALFRPSERFSSDGLARWEQLRHELMYVNRYFPDADIDVERLSSLLPQLVAENLPEQWYRARLMDGETVFQIADMGPPPARRSSHGRANPPGIPYLYLGSDPVSAISEVRPHTGEMVCVADFRLAEGLRIIDLRDPRTRLSPFSYGDEDQIGALREDLALLARLGDELTRPVLPSGAAIDYVPSQYLCELIKNAPNEGAQRAGYDGVIYSSTVGGGINLALFNPDRAVGGGVVQRRVNRVSVELEQFGRIRITGRSTPYEAPLPTPLPLRCADNVGTGFLVGDQASVWLVTCVHLITMTSKTPPDLALFDQALIHAQTAPVTIPLFENGAQRFAAVVNESDGKLIDVLTIKLSVTEAGALSKYGTFDLAGVTPPTVGAAALATGFPGVSVGDHSLATLEARIVRVEGISVVLSEPSTGGMSGGPLLSAGALVGVIHGDLGIAPKYTNALAISLESLTDQLFS